MCSDSIFSLKAKNYKCFGSEHQGFEKILPINLLIGRNNSGKSTVTDIVEHFISGNVPETSTFCHKGEKPEIHIRSSLSDSDLRSVFPESTSGGGLPGNNWWSYGKQWINKPMNWKISGSKKSFVSVEPDFSHDWQDKEARIQHLVSNHKTPLSNRSFKRLLADRDLLPEPEHSDMSIQPNGRGCTNLIQSLLNHAKFQRELVGKLLLLELNKIFAPDANFKNIYARKQENNNWEIFLEQEQTGSIALSQSGSGLKTIILILCFLHLLPNVENKKVGDYVFAFEEFENNLHPAAQRRVLQYLREFALNTGAIFLLTTHSTVAIDMFSTDKHAQILHVTTENDKSVVKVGKTYVEHSGILDDLDVRASDILQSNGVIWVEGPSDRIYLNRWIELWSDGRLKEGLHYQIVFYGGRLLAHFTALAPEPPQTEEISIFRLNRNAALIIDSDKNNPSEELNETKKRLISEIEASGGMAWITAGREIENYLPKKIVSEFIGSEEPKHIDQFQKFPNLLDQLKPGEGLGEKFNRQKAMFAEKISERFSKEQCLSLLDLNVKMTALCTKISGWNKIQT